MTKWWYEPLGRIKKSSVSLTEYLSSAREMNLLKFISQGKTGIQIYPSPLLLTSLLPNNICKDPDRFDAQCESRIYHICAICLSSPWWKQAKAMSLTLLHLTHTLTRFSIQVSLRGIPVIFSFIVPTHSCLVKQKRQSASAVDTITCSGEKEELPLWGLETLVQSISPQSTDLPEFFLRGAPALHAFVATTKTPSEGSCSDQRLIAQSFK